MRLEIFSIVSYGIYKYKCQMQMQHACTYNDKYLRMYGMRMMWEYEKFIQNISSAENEKYLLCKAFIHILDCFEI